MADLTAIQKLAVDTYKGTVATEFSNGKDTKEELREQLISANNGRTFIDHKAIRYGECPGLFRIIDEILNVTIVEGLQDTDFFMKLVDYRNLSLGDKNAFVTEDKSLFVVSEVSEGNMNIRRQRLGEKEKFEVKTSLHALRIYDELNRILARRVDFNEFIDRVGKSYAAKMLEEIFALVSNIGLAQLTSTYYRAGVFNDEEMKEMIDHLEAETGKVATIYATRIGASKLPNVEVPDSAKEEFYNKGYFGKYYGRNIMIIPQRHKTGTREFLFDNKQILVFCGGEDADSKPIKFVREGDNFTQMGDPLSNADLTQEYTYMERYGLGLHVSSAMMAKWDMA